jgi:hypothetical protein
VAVASTATAWPRAHPAAPAPLTATTTARASPDDAPAAIPASRAA